MVQCHIKYLIVCTLSLDLSEHVRTKHVLYFCLAAALHIVAFNYPHGLGCETC